MEGPASTEAAIQRPAESEPTNRWETPFVAKDVEKALLEATLSELPQGIGSEAGAPEGTPSSAPQSSAANSFSYKDLEEVLAGCKDRCLMPSSPVSLDGTRFQLWTLASAGDGWGYAAFAVRDNGGVPHIELMVRGEDISLGPGKNGTVVAQESVYQSNEPLCCPSGWAMRVYRWDDGKFVAAERFTGSHASGSSGVETSSQDPAVQSTPTPTP